MDIVAEFEVSDEMYVQVRKKENGMIDVVEITGDVEKIVQPDLTEREVICYFSHRLHNMHYLYNKQLKKG